MRDEDKTCVASEREKDLDKFNSQRLYRPQRKLLGTKKMTYRELFLDCYGYIFCEACGRNENGCWSIDLHHIVFRSEAPDHPKLHSNVNKVLICRACHDKAHGLKRQFRKHLIITRGLEKVFNMKLL